MYEWLTAGTVLMVEGVGVTTATLAWRDGPHTKVMRFQLEGLVCAASVTNVRCHLLKRLT